MKWTIFDDRFGEKLTPREGTWAKFCTDIENTKRVTVKNSSKLVKLATFGDLRTEKNSLRHDDNLIEVHGIEGDYDAGRVDPQEALDCLHRHGVEAIIVPSFSNAPGYYRWRVFASLSRPYPPGERLRFAEVLNGILGGCLAPESGTLSQSFYIGVRPGADYFVLKSEGLSLDDLDLMCDLEALRMPFKKSKCKGSDLTDSECHAWLDDLTSGDSVHPAMCRIVASLVARGVDGQTIKSCVLALAVAVEQSRGKDRADQLRGRELDDAIRSAQAKFGPKPDHYRMALAIRDRVGKGDITHTPEGVYQWHPDRGLWVMLDRSGVKQMIQRHLPDIPRVGAISKGTVDGVTDLFLNDAFSVTQAFNVGPVESVNCLNGEVEFNGTQWILKPHKREHYRTTQIPVAFDPEAKADRFNAFLGSVFAGDSDQHDKRLAILEAIGYSLVAHCRHERFYLLIGRGANGKSVLLSVIESLAGRASVCGVQPSQLGDGFMRAELQGKLLNIVSELRQGEVLDDAALKAIVSGEPSQVSRKYGQPFMLRPFATIWIGTNHIPHVRDFSDGLFRRAVVIEFNNQFTPALGNCDPHLKDALIAELPGILYLALSAYGRAIRQGFTNPASSVEAARKWRQEADQVAQFTEEVCKKDSDASVQTSVLFNVYQNWARGCGIGKTVAINSFVDRLKNLGFKKGEGRDRRKIIGLSLANEFDFEG